MRRINTIIYEGKMKSFIKKVVGAASMASLAGAAVFSTALPARAEASDASVYVVHGIAGQDLGLTASLPVDISVNGTCALTSFTFGEIAGPLSLPAGTYDVKIGLANSAMPCSEAPVISAMVPVASGENASIVAHLTEAGAPTASKFVNHISTAKKPRVILHHTAKAPAVDIELSRNPRYRLNKSIGNVSNGAQASVDLVAGKWDASLFLPGTSTRVFGVDKIPFKQKTTTLVYVVGSPETGSLTYLTKVVPAL